MLWRVGWVAMLAPIEAQILLPGPGVRCLSSIVQSLSDTKVCQCLGIPPSQLLGHHICCSQYLGTSADWCYRHASGLREIDIDTREQVL
jgi:hypothetical protein